MTVEIVCKKKAENCLSVESRHDGVYFSFGRMRSGEELVELDATLLPVDALLQLRDFLCDHLFGQALYLADAVPFALKCTNEQWGVREQQWGPVLSLSSATASVVLSEKAVEELIRFCNSVNPDCALSAQHWYEYDDNGRNIEALRLVYAAKLP